NRYERRRALSIRKRNATTPAETVHASKPNRSLSVQFNTASPRVLLLGTALASTFLLASIAAPSTAQAQSNCMVGGAAVTLDPAPDPILITPAPTPPANGPIICVNTEARTRGAGPYIAAIELTTNGDEYYIDLTNSGPLTADPVAGEPSVGIRARATGQRSTITVTNTGDILARSNDGRVFGMSVDVRGVESTATIENRGSITAKTYGNLDAATGMLVLSMLDDSAVAITNVGEVEIETVAGTANGIFTAARGSNSSIDITNRDTITAKSSGGHGFGIFARTYGARSTNVITNSGAINADAGDHAYGIFGRSSGAGSSITIDNGGAINADAGYDAFGIYAWTEGPNSPIDIVNTGSIYAAGPQSTGIYATSDYANQTTITNTGTIGASSHLAIDVKGAGTAHITNAGTITGYVDLTDQDDRFENRSGGVFETQGTSDFGGGDDLFDNQTGATVKVGKKVVTAFNGLETVWNAGTFDLDDDASLNFDDSATGFTNRSGGAVQLGDGATVDFGGGDDFFDNQSGATVKVGKKVVTAFNGLETVWNAGTFDLDDDASLTFDDSATDFTNRSGGAVQLGDGATVDFGGGDDFFDNQSGATVGIGSDPSKSESFSFENLETFRNSGGTISLVDGGVGDRFTLANTPGEADLDFEGGGFVAVDANLAGPGSQGDSFIVDGDVSGVTRVVVNNASSLPGVLNADGIPIIYVEGATPNENNFVLADGPIDTGLFDYDLFFVPTGSGVWQLRSFVSGAAYALPKLLTAAQDLWHQTSATWFDRTADLRVILQGGEAPAYHDATQSLGEPGQKRLRSDGLTPAVWMKGGGSRLDRDGSATTSAYGRTYNYDLDNEFSSFDLQVGVDMGQYDVINQGDVLIFGVLGGFVGGKLDYDSLADTFDFSGGQVGAYATYLKDGLFVDTLLNVHLYEINTPNLCFSDSLDATTVGLRTDAGYRFGSFTGGAFFEPLATIEVTWADIDGFSAGGNRVSFSDDANVRGRIGGRVGTTMQAWEGTMMEPFLIASLWGNLSDDNSARLVSSGTTFNFQDDLDDIWGEVSGGVNLFNFSQTTSVFAKVDYTFGENVQGVGGKGGIRVAW
ncbi:MAG: autotransporter domain-containing protein, partial [Pseudomonadota bacterium]